MVCDADEWCCSYVGSPLAVARISLGASGVVAVERPVVGRQILGNCFSHLTTREGGIFPTIPGKLYSTRFNGNAASG